MSVPEHTPGSRTSAGFPSPADDYIDKSLDLNELLIKNRTATFFMKVDGDGLASCGIANDDMLIVDRSVYAVQGKIVVAVIDGELVVRKVESQGDKLVLTSDDSSKGVDFLDQPELQVWGVVTAVVHRF